MRTRRTNAPRPPQTAPCTSASSPLATTWTSTQPLDPTANSTMRRVTIPPRPTPGCRGSGHGWGSGWRHADINQPACAWTWSDTHTPTHTFSLNGWHLIHFGHWRHTHREKETDDVLEKECKRKMFYWKESVRSKDGPQSRTLTVISRRWGHEAQEHVMRQHKLRT